MPPRASKATPKKLAGTNPSTPQAISNKRKIDWGTIDEKEPFSGFTVTLIKAKAPPKTSGKTPTKTPQANTNKKRKTDSRSSGAVDNLDAPLDAEAVARNPFPECDLSDLHYVIEPKDEWESAGRYRKFTISGAEFEVNQNVWVKPDPEEEEVPNTPVPNWVARVLEVRAGDPSHVYLRVYWMYRPEDLPDGRQPYHGESELIASNDMAIIDVLTVQDAANVIHWDDNPNKSTWPMKDQLFWRQTMDIEKKKRCSKLRKVCVDKQPCNPDEPLIYCPSCKKWLHAGCVEGQAVRDAYEENTTVAKGRPPKDKETIDLKSLSEADFSAYLTLQESEKTCLTVTDKRPGQDNRRWNVDLNCLFCAQLIEKAAEDVPPEAPVEEEDKAGDIAVDTTDLVDATTKHASADTEDDVDSVIGKDEPVEPSKKNISASDTADAEPAAAPVTNGRRPRGCLAKRRAMTSSANATVAAAVRVETPSVPSMVGTITPEATPAPAPPSDTILQSGIKSVKRLFWRTS